MKNFSIIDNKTGREYWISRSVKCRINKNQEWRKCIKISDDLGKHLGDDKEFEIAKYQLGI